MGHSNGKITAPVGLDSDVYPTLGIGPTSDGYDLGYACANTHGKINWRSKKKPVVWNNPSINISNSKWWIGENGDCGMVASVKGPLYSVINGKWNYNPPKNGNWFSLSDFDGYYQNAGSPIEHGYNGGIDIDKIKDKELRIMFAVPYDDMYRFTPADMKSLKNTYITAYITNGSHQFKVSAPATISNRNNEDNATTITIPTSEFYKGEYTCYIVFSTSRFILGQQEPSSNFYPFISDYGVPSSFKIRVKQESPVEVNFLSLSYSSFGTFVTIQDAGDIFDNDMVWVMYTSGDIAATVSIYNRGDEPVSILRNQLRISTRTIHDTDIVRDGTMFDGALNTQGITISKGQTKTVKMLYNDIILYNGNIVQKPSMETRLKTLSATMRYYSQDGSSWAAAGGSAIYNVKYSPTRREWVKESINQ